LKFKTLASSTISTRTVSSEKVCLSSIWHKLPTVATTTVGGSAWNLRKLNKQKEQEKGLFYKT